MRRKKALVIGIANRDSISAGIADELSQNGCRIIPTYLNEKALPFVKKVTDKLEVERLFPFQVGNNQQLESIVEHLQSNWYEV